MVEKKTLILTFKVEMPCPKCGKAMIHRNLTVPSADCNKYLHRCRSCGHEQLLDRVYPYREEVDAPEPSEQEKIIDDLTSAGRKKTRKG